MAMTIAKDIIVRDSHYFMVSTVLLPFAAHRGGEYETMIFRATADGEVVDFDDLYCDRYGSPAAARAGHTRAVAEWVP